MLVDHLIYFAITIAGYFIFEKMYRAGFVTQISIYFFDKKKTNKRTKKNYHEKKPTADPQSLAAKTQAKREWKN